MERWVAIILGLVVIVIGFVVVGEIMDANETFANTGDDARCIANLGTCKDSCGSGETAHQGITCSDSRSCCVKN